MNFSYISLRLIRRLTPSFIVNNLLKRNFILEAAQGTNNPKTAVDNYQKRLINASIKNKIILELGYGGCFGTAVEFLKRGAQYVYLIDKFAKPDQEKNRRIFRQYPKYFNQIEQKIAPKQEYITVIEDDIVNWQNRIKADIIVSSAVFEHIRNVEDTISALGKIMNKGGTQSHYIDLSDHFKKYPFEMLCYSDWFWNNFLNPKENLNRFRIKDYLRLFKNHFSNVEYFVPVNDIKNFIKTKPRIKKKFLSDNDKLDSATAVLIIAY